MYSLNKVSSYTNSPCLKFHGLCQFFQSLSLLHTRLVCNLHLNTCYHQSEQTSTLTKDPALMRTVYCAALASDEFYTPSNSSILSIRILWFTDGSQPTVIRVRNNVHSFHYMELSQQQINRVKRFNLSFPKSLNSTAHLLYVKQFVLILQMFFDQRRTSRPPVF